MTDFDSMTEDEYWAYLEHEADVRSQVMSEQTGRVVDLALVEAEVARRMADHVR